MTVSYPIAFEAFSKEVEFYDELVSMHREVSAYLLKFRWCKVLKNSSVYLNLGSTLSVFVFEIENTASAEDNYLWVIAGDLPSMYLDVHGAKTTRQVLEDYTNLAKDWVAHVRNGKSLQNCYPFDAEPTVETALLLEKRAVFIKDAVIDHIADIPFLIE